MKKLTLVLGGGACKGYAHIGVLRVLEENNIKPDLIVGTSMGAVIGGAYACGKTSKHLIDISKKMTKKRLMDFNIFGAIFTTGIMSGKKLRKVLEQEIGDMTHENLEIPFTAISTDILKGKTVLLNKGRVVDNMLASSAIPGVYPIVNINGLALCDGGVLNNVPDDIAKNINSDNIILSIDVIGEYSKQVESSKIKVMGLTINALTLMQTEITRLQGNNSDLRIIITQPDVAQMSFDRKSVEKSIQYGIEAMQKNMVKLKKLLKD